MLKVYLKKHTGILLILGLITGLIAPRLVEMYQSYYIYLSMFLMVFSLLSINSSSIKTTFISWPRVFSIMSIAFLLPILLFVLFRKQISTEIFWGMILSFLSGVSIYTTSLSSIFDNSSTKSLVIVLISNLFFYLIVPHLSFIEIDKSLLSQFLFLNVLVPYILAFFIRQSNAAEWIENKTNLIAPILLALITSIFSFKIRDIIIENIKFSIAITLAIFLILSIVAICSYMLAKGDDEKDAMVFSSVMRGHEYFMISNTGYSLILLPIAAYIIAQYILVSIYIFIRK